MDKSIGVPSIASKSSIGSKDEEDEVGAGTADGASVLMFVEGNEEDCHADDEDKEEVKEVVTSS